MAAFRRPRRRILEVDAYLAEASTKLEAARGLLFKAKPEEIAPILWGGSYFGVDIECGSNLRPGNSHYACKQCEVLGRLTKGQLGSGIPFCIECGKSVGEEFVILPRDASIHPYTTTGAALGVEAAKILAAAPLLSQCGYANPDSYIECDPLTLEVLVRSYVGQLALPAPQLVTAFQCGYERYIVQEWVADNWARYARLSQTLEEGTCHDALLQLVGQLKLLAPLHYTAGRVDASTISVRKSGPAMKLEGTHITGERGFSLSWSPGSSLTVPAQLNTPSMRLCLGLTTALPAHPKLTLRKLQLDTQLITLYKLDIFSYQSFLAYRRAGVPLYPGSLELYCTLLTLMVHPSVCSYLLKRHSRLLSMLWMGELETVLAQLAIWRQRPIGYPNFEEMIRFLLGKWLRCDALGLCWSVLAAL